MGNIYYVDPATGSDSNTGTAPDQAWATIAPIFSVEGSGTDRPDGDTVYVRRGSSHRLENNISATQNSTLFRIYGWPSSSDAWYAQRPQAGIDAGWDDDNADMPSVEFRASVDMKTNTIYALELKGLNIKHAVASAFLVQKYNITISHCNFASEGTGNDIDGFVRAYVITGHHSDHTCEISDCTINTERVLYAVEGDHDSSDNFAARCHIRRNKGKIMAPHVVCMHAYDASSEVVFEDNELEVRNHVILYKRETGQRENIYVTFNRNKIYGQPSSIALYCDDVRYLRIRRFEFTGNTFYGRAVLYVSFFGYGLSRSALGVHIDAQDNYVELSEHFAYLNGSNYDTGVNIAISNLKGTVQGTVLYFKSMPMYDYEHAFIRVGCKDFKVGRIFYGGRMYGVHYSQDSGGVNVELENCSVGGYIFDSTQLYCPTQLRMIRCSAAGVANGGESNAGINVYALGSNLDNGSPSGSHFITMYAQGGSFSGVWRNGVVDISSAYIGATMMNGVIRNAELPYMPDSETGLEVFSCVIGGQPAPYRKKLGGMEFGISPARRVNGSDGSMKAISKEHHWFFLVDRIKLQKPQGKSRAKFYFASHSPAIFDATIDLNVFYMLGETGQAFSVDNLHLSPSQEEWSGLYSGYLAAEMDVDFGFSEAAQMYVAMVVRKQTSRFGDLYIDLQPSWS